MPLHVPGSLDRLLSLLAPCFSQPTFQTFRALALGFVGRIGDHTITGMWQAVGLAGRVHHSRAHDFFARRRWDPDELGLLLLDFLVAVFVKPEVAAAAEVSEATVFNYFATKEDLVFHRMVAFEDELLTAIRDRPESESLARAFGRFALKPRGFLASNDSAATESMRTVARVMSESPALLARQRDILDRYADTLAGQIAQERGIAADDPEPWVIANALIGLHRALIAYTHRQALAGVPNPQIARNLRTAGKRALGRLEHGLG